jgi:hypothetical protein
VDFVLREGVTDIHCRISFAALSRLGGADELSRGTAERLLHWYRLQIERIALARYAAGDFVGGMVTIDIGDVGAPSSRGQ